MLKIVKKRYFSALNALVLMSLKNLLFVTIGLFFSGITIAQRNYNNYNKLGITAGLTLYDIQTSNFETEPGESFMVGFSTRGAFRNNFDLIYGLSFYNTEVGIKGSLANDTQYIDFSMQSAQITFLGSYNIIMHHLSVEAGPVLNINGKLNPKSDSYDSYVLEGYSSLLAKDIADVSIVHFHVAAGLTAGIENFRIIGRYQYGVTNLFHSLNDKESIETDGNKLKGNSSLITIAAVFYF